MQDYLKEGVKAFDFTAAKKRMMKNEGRAVLGASGYVTIAHGNGKVYRAFAIEMARGGETHQRPRRTQSVPQT